MRCLEVRDKDFAPVINELTVQFKTETSKEMNTIQCLSSKTENIMSHPAWVGSGGHDYLEEVISGLRFKG